jgi:hypothetical protein
VRTNVSNEHGKVAGRRIPTAETRIRKIFVADEEALGQVFFKYFGFPCQLALRQLLHIYYRRFIVSILTSSLNNQPKKHNYTIKGTKGKLSL